MVMFNDRKLLAGIQDFEYLRTDGYLYVDKTQYIYRLANTGKHYIQLHGCQFRTKESKFRIAV